MADSERVLGAVSGLLRRMKKAETVRARHSAVSPDRARLASGCRNSR